MAIILQIYSKLIRFVLIDILANMRKAGYILQIAIIYALVKVVNTFYLLRRAVCANAPDIFFEHFK